MSTLVRSIANIVAVLLVVSSSGAHAQTASVDTNPRLDVTIARHTMSGGTIDYRTGGMLDLLLAVPVHNAPTWKAVVAIGGGGVFGGTGDRCLFLPDGTCAPQANFRVLDALVGADMSVGGAALRGLVGPAYYAGNDRHAIGAQGRIDVSSPTLAHFGLGAMLRATWLPSYVDQHFIAWAIGGSLVIR